MLQRLDGLGLQPVRSASGGFIGSVVDDLDGYAKARELCPAKAFVISPSDFAVVKLGRS